MKTFTLTCLLLGAWLISFPQNGQKESFHGGVHTPKGRLHMLLIFVRYEDKNLRPWDKEKWADTDDLPQMAVGADNGLFYSNPEPLLEAERNKNISEFYHTMSGGKFIITADVFPVQVPVKYIPENSRNFFARQGQLNKAAVEWIVENYPGFDWSQYDRRTNNPSYRYDNSESKPDSILDYVMFLHRDQGQTGMGASSRFDIPGTPYRVQNGHTGIKTFVGAKHNWEYFKHEFSHNLFSCPHYMGANHTAGNKLYVQKGWGLMSAGSPPFFTANAWERWWLGWYEPQEIETKGSYKLKDFVTTGDAIRIKIPGTRDYLWLENHQKIDPWDDKIFYTDPEQFPTTAPGIYAYVVAEAGADRNNPLTVFNTAHCNLMKLLNGQGHFDWIPGEDTVQTQYFPTIALKRAAPNPIAGQNDMQGIRHDFNGDGKIPIAVNHGNTDKRSGEGNEVWAEEVDGYASATYNIMGDELDAFDEGDEISLSGILPALNYPVYTPRSQTLGPFILNGLRILIGEKDSSGTYTLDISFDDWEVRKSQRWCGHIVLPSANGSSKAKSLEIAEKAVLTLDLSGTVSRSTPHETTQTFANPTQLSLRANRQLILHPKSQLIVDHHSILELTANSQVVVEKGAKLIIQGQGQLVMSENSKIIVRKGGRVYIQADGRYRPIDNAKVEVERGGIFKVKG